MNALLKTLNVELKTTLWLLVSSVLFIMLSSITSAQSAPELIITWKSNAYASPSYSNKVLPTRGSIVTLSAEIVDAGKPVDLSRTQLIWRANTELVAQRIGAETVTYTIPDDASGEITIDLSLFYRGVERTAVIYIPIAEPEIVIDAPTIDNTIGAGIKNIKALLYSFNISNPDHFNTSWTANGYQPEGSPANPLSLELNTSVLPIGQLVALKITLQDKNNPTRIFSQLRQLTIR